MPSSLGPSASLLLPFSYCRELTLQLLSTSQRTLTLFGFFSVLWSNVLSFCFSSEISSWGGRGELACCMFLPSLHPRVVSDQERTPPAITDLTAPLSARRPASSSGSRPGSSPLFHRCSCGAFCPLGHAVRRSETYKCLVLV